MKRRMVLCGTLIIVIAMIYSISDRSKAAEGAKQYLRVGVYDSRAVAIAHAHSDQWGKVLKEKMAEMEKARAAGNEEKVRQLEEWGSQHQAEAHLMGFGTAPVTELLEPYKDQVAQVARENGIDLIVSKWQFDYLAKDAETVDLTDQIVRLYHPNDRAQKIIDQLDTWQPLSREEIEAHDH